MKHYHRIPEYPAEVSAGTILTRLLDGLGFRFHWATEGLRKMDYVFRPSPDCMSVEELVRHIWGLINWVTLSMTGTGYSRPENVEAVREQILEMVWSLRNWTQGASEERLAEVTIEGLPFWHMVNGPISDALTHVGQINSFRRLSGNPVQGANVFTGTLPKDHEA